MRRERPCRSRTGIGRNGETIGVADYQLIVPQEELKKVVAEELEAFGKEFPLHAETKESLK